MLAWLRRRRAAKALIQSDADDLMAAFGDQAASIAKDRAADTQAGLYVDADPARTEVHWWRVRGEIHRRTGKEVVDTATRYILDQK